MLIPNQSCLNAWSPPRRMVMPSLILLLALAGCQVTPTPTVLPPSTDTPVPTDTPNPIVTVTPTDTPAPESTPTATPPTFTPAPGLTLFETPRDGPAPVLNAIHSATHAVDVEVYELGDPDVINALIGDQQAGRQVRVILNQHFPTGGNSNAATFQQLQNAGVAVHWANPAYTYTHEKAIIVDAGQSTQEVLIMTLNLRPGYLGKPDPEGISLNFGLVDPSSADVSQAEAIFEADWQDLPYIPPADTPLVISPVNSRAALLNEIQAATHSIHFFAQEFEDRAIVNAMVAAAQRGVEVKGLLAPNISGNLASANTLKAAGGQARYLAQPYEHAKATIVDGAVVYIGSINYTATSLDKNRELGILTRQADIAAQMEAEFARFWDQGTDTP
jgi:cardiolipin synthase A/B